MSKFIENDEGVHIWSAVQPEYTLCGDAFDISGAEACDSHGGEFQETTSRTVTCSRCIAEIKNCRGVKVKPLTQRNTQ